MNVMEKKILCAVLAVVGVFAFCAQAVDSSGYSTNLIPMAARVAGPMLRVGAMVWRPVSVTR